MNTAATEPKIRICPYPGLRPFNANESIYFKGREVHVEKILDQLREKKFLMLTGASGDGKSSIVYAGLIPNANAGFFRAKFGQWSIIDFRPERAPLVNFAKSLSGIIKDKGKDSLVQTLSLGYSSLVDTYLQSSLYLDENKPEIRDLDAKELRKMKSKASNLLIIIDQFEELFTSPENYSDGKLSDQSKALVNLILETNKIAREKDLPIYIVCTMRSDYIGNCSELRGFPELIGESHYFIPRLNRNEVFQAIDEPALLSGNHIAIRLVERLLYDLKEGMDVLPVLQHTLFRIWKVADERGDDAMDLVHYAMVGGMAQDELPEKDQKKFNSWYVSLSPFKQRLLNNACIENVLDAHANELYENAHEYYNSTHTDSTISKEKALTIVRKTFTYLTKLDESKAVRHRMSLKEIAEITGTKEYSEKEIAGVLRIFIIEGNSLLQTVNVKGDTENPNTMVADTILDITHEALIRNWKQLNSWVKEEQESADNLHDLTIQLNRWKENNKGDDFLLSVGQYNYFREWYEKQQPTIAWVRRYCIYGCDRQMPEKEMIEATKKKLEEFQEFFEKSKKKLDKKKRLTKGIIAVISILLVFSVFAFLRSEKQKTIAITEQGKAIQANKISQANALAMKSLLMVENNPTFAFRLGEAAYSIQKTSLAKQAIMAAYGEIPYYSLLTKHAGIVLDARFSSDGKYILTCSEDNFSLMLDLQGKEIIRLGNDSIQIRTAKFSPDDKTILTYHNKSSVLQLWDTKGNLLRSLTGHKEDVLFADFSPDGRDLISTSKDSTAILWNLNGDILHVFRGHSNIVNFACFSSNDGLILTSSEDNTSRLWDRNGSCTKIFQPQNEKFTYTKFLDNSHRIISYGKNNKIMIRDISGKINKVLNNHAREIRTLTVSPDGKTFFSGSDDRTARLWDKDGNELLVLKGHNAPVNYVGFSPDGEILVTVSEDITLRLWDMKGNCTQVLKPDDLTYSAEFSTDGKYIVTTHNAGNVYLWKVQNQRSFILKGHTDFIWEACFSPDGEHIATASWDNTARVWNKNGKEICILTGHTAKIYNIAFSPDNKFILTGSDDNTARIWDFDGNCLSVLTGHTEKIFCIDISPDGKYIVTASGDNTARIWNTKGEVLHILKGHISYVVRVKFSFDGKYIVTASGDNTARLWNSNGVLLHQLKGHSAEIYNMAFAPDSKTLATASSDNTVRIWNIKGEELAVCKGHSANLVYVTFSHNNQFLATAANDHTARLWDLSGNEIMVFKGHTGMVNTVRFSADDKYILTSSDDGTARLWDINGTEINVYKGHNGVVQDARFSPEGKYILTASKDGTARLWPIFVEDALHNINVKKERGEVWQLSDEEKSNLEITAIH